MICELAIQRCCHRSRGHSCRVGADPRFESTRSRVCDGTSRNSIRVQINDKVVRCSEFQVGLDWQVLLGVGRVTLCGLRAWQGLPQRHTYAAGRGLWGHSCIEWPRGRMACLRGRWRGSNGSSSSDKLLAGASSLGNLGSFRLARL